MPTCRWMDSDGRNVTDWLHHPSGRDLLESTHPQVPLWCRVYQLAAAMWRRIRIAIIGKEVGELRTTCCSQNSLSLCSMCNLYSFASPLPFPSSSPHCAGGSGRWCMLVHSQKRTGDKGCVHHGGQNIG